MARRQAGAEAPQPDQAFCERAPLLAHLRSGYALPTSRQQRQIPILIEVRFSPQILAPRGGHYWTRKGVAIGSDLTGRRAETTYWPTVTPIFQRRPGAFCAITSTITMSGATTLLP